MLQKFIAKITEYTVHKSRIFENFSKAEVGGSAYIWAHISCKENTWEIIIECINFRIHTLFSPLLNMFLLTEKWRVIELFKLAAKTITWNLKLTI